MPLISSIFASRFEPLTKWSNRALNGERQKLCQKIRSVLDLLSGSDISRMLYDILSKNERRDVAGKYYQGMKNLSEPINKIKAKNKHYFILPLKMADFTLKDLEDLGIKCGEKLWSTCKSPRERLHGGRQKLSSEKVLLINEVMESCSNVSSFKSVTVRKRLHEPITSKFEVRQKQIKLDEKNRTELQLENVRCRTITITEAKAILDQRRAIDGDGNTFSMDTFRRYVNDHQPDWDKSGVIRR